MNCHRNNSLATEEFLVSAPADNLTVMGKVGLFAGNYNTRPIFVSTNLTISFNTKSYKLVYYGHGKN